MDAGSPAVRSWAGMTDLMPLVLVAAPPTITGGLALLLGWLNKRKLAQVETKVDGRLTELLELTRKSSRAEGVKDQKEKGRKPK